MMLRCIKLICIVLFLSSTMLLGGNIDYSSSTINYITVSNGLPQNTIQCIEKDYFGFMWFGTDNGLCRYDGYDFEYYESSRDSMSLWDNRILDVVSGINQYLWITTPKGLQVFNTLTRKFEIIEDGILKDLCKEKIVHIKVDGTNVWIATKNHGVYRLRVGRNISKIKLENHYFKESNLLDVSLIEIGVDRSVFLGTNSGLYVLNEEINLFEKLKSKEGLLDKIRIQTLYDTDKELWIGTINGIYRYSKNTNSAVAYFHNPYDNTTIPHESITSIGESAIGEVIVGTLGGLCVFNRKLDNFIEINLFPESIQNNHDIFIRSLYADSIGNIWVGTEKTGLVHLYSYGKKFYSFSNEERFSAFNKNIINSIYHSNNILWVGTAGKGLLKYDSSNDKITQYKVDSRKPGDIKSDFITSVLEDDKGQIWVGTWGRGIQKLRDKEQSNFTNYNLNQGLSNGFISCIYTCENDLMVVGTQGGLNVYNRSLDKFFPIELTCGAGGEVWEVGCIQEDAEGFLWVGTTNGLYSFNKELINPEEEIQLTKYDIIAFKEAEEKGSIPDNYITSIDLDKEGYIWIGTYGKGIAKCIPQDDDSYVFKNYTEKDGLTNNVVYEIISDINNDFWVSTENGLSKFTQQTKSFISYFSKDGLRNDQYYWSAACEAENGYLYFGGLNGLNFFHPDSIENYPYVPNTYITKLKVFNHDVAPGEKRHGIIPIKESVFNVDTINLSYKDNVFSLEFSALPYYLSSKVKYAYQLQGVDKDWVYVNADRRLASYTNLNGGEYLFQLKSTDLDGQWNKASTVALININPPVWKTRWFQIILLCVIFILISGYIRYRSFRISQQKKQLERLVKERTIEIKEKNEQLEHNALTLKAKNEQLASRQKKIENQKSQLESQNKEIITQRDQLITLNKEIESIHQMRMQFFTNISHEFRTPLTLIISPIEKILNENFSFTKENVKNAVKYVKRNAERLLLLTNEIMTFRKYEAGKVKVVLTNGNVGDFITEIAESFRQLAESKGVKFNIFVDYNLENTWYDQAKLENILFNLISNAIKYTNELGSVSISVSKITNEIKRSRLLIKIQDSGIGIKKEYQDKVFDRFYRETSNQVNSSYGTGIGLALTKQMVEVLNGTISLDSEINKGSSFKVILPVEEVDFPEHELQIGESRNQILLKERIGLLAEGSSNKPSLYKDDEKGSGVNKYKLLVVDDNRDLREFLAESLSSIYSVQTAINGEEGYKLALEKDFDLVISDVMMPKVNGLELCRQLKNNIHTSHVPVILLTAKGQEADFVDGLEHGADDYISKPFNFKVLQAKVNSLIENRKKLFKLYQQIEPINEEVNIKTNSLDEEFMEKVNQVISNNYTDPTFDLDIFSSQMYVSRSLLYKKLKALTNVSPNEYINIYRLKKSEQLLKSGQYQISEIAFLVGFNDPKYFSRVFKKFYNCSPSSYLE